MQKLTTRYLPRTKQAPNSNATESLEVAPRRTYSSQPALLEAFMDFYSQYGIRSRMLSPSLGETLYIAPRSPAPGEDQYFA